GGRLSLYLYVNDNPISYTDPYGLQGVPAPARPPQAPRIPVCLRWICTICVDELSASCPPRPIRRCTTFIVNAPPGHPTDPGSGNFAGPGGFAGNAKKMPECICTDSVPYPF